MHGAHALSQRVFGFGPHQVHIAVGGAQINRLRGVAAEIKQRPTLLVGPYRIGVEPLELVNFSLVIDLILAPGLLEYFDHFPRAAIAVVVAGRLARKIRRDDIQNQAPAQHVVQSSHGARQHDGLHFATTDGGQKIHARGQGGHGRHKAQGVLPHLVGRRAQNIAVAERIGPRGHRPSVFPTAAQSPLRHAQMPVIV